MGALDNVVRDMNVDETFRMILASIPARPMSDAEKVKKLRSALAGMVELVTSFEDVSFTRDLPEHEAESIYITELANAKSVLREVA